LDKLETFFINIVARAQQQAVPTSGAESKTQISDFLSTRTDERVRREAILNELVSSSPPDEQTVNPDTKTVQPQPSPVSVADENLLRQLTEQANSKPITTQPTQIKPAPAQSTIRPDE